MNKFCCIFFYEGYVGVAPTVINLAKSLSAQKYSVTIYATKNDYPQIDLANDNINIIYFLKGYDIPTINNFYNLLYKNNIFTGVIPIIEIIIFIFQSLLYSFKNYRLITPQKSFNIGIDTNGSILALIHNYIFKSKFAYLSLEITSLSHYRKLSRLLKFIEYIAYRKAECIIIQDKDRFTSLCKYNHYQHPNVFYLPNSSSINDSRSSLVNQDNNYFRNIFNLSQKDFSTLIIQAGMICDEVYSQELASAFSSINNGVALIFHERQKKSLQDPYIKTLTEINSANLFLSLDPLPYEEIDKVFASVTIGLAFYRNIDNNFSQIAKASGKLSFYLKHGRPVLVNNIESLSTLVEKYKIGVVINNPSDPIEIESAIKTILDNYSFYSKNAKACFAQEFDFASQVNPLLSLICK
ncbi:hypothetical protein NIES4071_93010 [Calothrix sp. NIES-4071]|nr:hypothetical protein NIES4071_93010 [Calothrix sp. NIES-4071]BAZ63568.1 hypothetical protein NIES4105_92940 [Calothrix sp. NIES-4105]